MVISHTNRCKDNEETHEPLNLSGSSLLIDRATPAKSMSAFGPSCLSLPLSLPSSSDPPPLSKFKKRPNKLELAVRCIPTKLISSAVPPQRQARGAGQGHPLARELVTPFLIGFDATLQACEWA